MSDERLAALSAAGDERAFAVLYRRHEAVLLRYCRSITGDFDDARDALQSAMLGALGAIARGGPEGQVRPWLFRIARNESISVLRRRRGEVRMAEPEPSVTAAGGRRAPGGARAVGGGGRRRAQRRARDVARGRRRDRPPAGAPARRARAARGRGARLSRRRQRA